MNNNLFGGLFGRIEPGLCRLGMNGGIAIKTKNGYKTYNTKTGRLTNCDQFVFNIGEEFFFVIPTNKVAVGDIILVNGRPRCVVKMEDNRITAINYEDSTVDTIIPERHIIMGNAYLYGKIISMFGSNPLNGKKGMSKIMTYLMMSEMLKGTSTGAIGGIGAGNNSLSALLPFMMMGGRENMGNMFSDLFDFDANDVLPVFDSDKDKKDAEEEE